MIEEIHNAILLKRKEYLDQNKPVPDLEIHMTPECKNQCLADKKANMYIDINRFEFAGYPFFTRPGQKEPFLIVDKEC